MAGTLSTILAGKADLENGKLRADQVPESIGESGASAYELAVQEGFIGTLQAWLDSLQGQDGANGTDGVTPVKGVDYFDGLPGADGADGYTPVKNVDYFDGVKGDKGDTGDQGIQGLPGSDATVTKLAVESVLTGEISTHTHAGGSGGLTQAQILTRQL